MFSAEQEEEASLFLLIYYFNLFILLIYENQSEHSVELHCQMG